MDETGAARVMRGLLFFGFGRSEKDRIDRATETEAVSVGSAAILLSVLFGSVATSKCEVVGGSNDMSSPRRDRSPCVGSGGGISAGRVVEPRRGKGGVGARLCRVVL